MYVVDLYRKNGTGTHLGKDIIPEISHSVLGYNDLLSIRKVNSFSGLLNISIDNDNFKKENRYFLKQSIALFPLCDDAPNELGESALIDEIMNDCDNSLLYMFISCKLNQQLFSIPDDTGERSGMSLLENVKKSLVEVLKPYTPDLRYQIFGNLGSFDITIIVSMNSLKTLNKIPPVIIKKTLGDNQLLAISYAFSFVTFNRKNFDISQLRDEEVDFSVRIVTYYSEIPEMLKSLNSLDMLKDCSIVIGDYDINIDIKEVKFKEVIQLFLGTSIFSMENPDYYKYFRTVYSVLMSHDIPEELKQPVVMSKETMALIKDINDKKNIYIEELTKELILNRKK